MGIKEIMKALSETGYKVVPLGLDAKGKPKRPLVANWQEGVDPEIAEQLDIAGVGVVLGEQPNGLKLGCVDIDIANEAKQIEIIEKLGLQNAEGIEHSVSGKLHIFFQYLHTPEKSYYKIPTPEGNIEIFFDNRQIALGFPYHNEPNPLTKPFLLPVWSDEWLDILNYQETENSNGGLVEIVQLIKKALENGWVDGWLVDRALAHYLLFEQKLTKEEAKIVFQSVFGTEYNPEWTDMILERTKTEPNPVRMPSLLFVLKQHPDKEARKLFVELLKVYKKNMVVDYLFYDSAKAVYWYLDETNEVKILKNREDIEIYLTRLFGSVPGRQFLVEILSKTPERYFVYNPNSPKGWLSEDTFNVFQAPSWYWEIRKTNTTPLKEQNAILQVLRDKASNWYEYFVYLFAEEPEKIPLFLKWLKFKIINGKTGVSFVFRTRQGVGKDKVIKEILLYKLFGADNVTQMLADDVIRRFNSAMLNKIWVVANEVVFDTTARNKGASVLKGYLTNDKIYIEQKGLNVWELDNYLDFIFFTNEYESIRIEADDRRFVMVENYTVPQMIERFDLPGFFETLRKELSGLVEIIKALDITDFLKEVQEIKRKGKAELSYLMDTSSLDFVLNSDIEELIESLKPYLVNLPNTERLLVFQGLAELKHKVIKTANLLIILKLLGEKNWTVRRLSNELKKRGWVRKHSMYGKYFTFSNDFEYHKKDIENETLKLRELANL